MVHEMGCECECLGYFEIPIVELHRGFKVGLIQSKTAEGLLAFSF